MWAPEECFGSTNGQASWFRFGSRKSERWRTCRSVGRVFQRSNQRLFRAGGLGISRSCCGFPKERPSSVKGFELAGAAVHEEKDNRPVLDQLGVLEGGCATSMPGIKAPPKPRRRKFLLRSFATQIQHGMIISCFCSPCHADSLPFILFSKTNFLSLPFG